MHSSFTLTDAIMKLLYGVSLPLEWKRLFEFEQACLQLIPAAACQGPVLYLLNNCDIIFYIFFFFSGRIYIAAAAQSPNLTFIQQNWNRRENSGKNILVIWNLLVIIFTIML